MGKEQSDLLKYLFVGIGGCLGSILRFWLGSYIGSKMGTRFPYGTLVINVTGSFLIGLIFALLTVRTNWSPNWRYLIPIGFIGGYTRRCGRSRMARLASGFSMWQRAWLSDSLRFGEA
jgi:hypothetical protein